MNKWIVVFAIFAVINSAIADSSSSEEVLEKVKSKHVKKYLHQNRERIDEGFEKLEKHCPGVTEKLKTALISFQECDDRVDDSLTICAAIQTSALNCTTPVLKVVDDCLPAKAKGLPTLGVKSLLSVADFLCKQSGESIFELANPCLFEDDETDTNVEIDKCEEKIKDIVAKYEGGDHIPDKTEVCTSLTGLKTCVHTHAATNCKNQKTKDVVNGLYDAIIAPCTHINEVEV